VGDRRAGRGSRLVSLRPTGTDRELIVAIGAGIAFAAAQAAMRHGFEGLRLPRIVATVDLPNRRSHRLMERLGFVATGEADGPKYRHRTYVAVSAAASSTSSTRC
jgi:hypothetical protein